MKSFAGARASRLWLTPLANHERLKPDRPTDAKRRSAHEENGHAYADAPTQEGRSLGGKVKNPDDPLTKNLRAAGPEHLREGAPPPQKSAPEKSVQEPALQDKRKGRTSCDRDHDDGDYEFD